MATREQMLAPDAIKQIESGMTNPITHQPIKTTSLIDKGTLSIKTPSTKRPAVKNRAEVVDVIETEAPFSKGGKSTHTTAEKVPLDTSKSTEKDNSKVVIIIVVIVLVVAIAGFVIWRRRKKAKQNDK